MSGKRKNQLKIEKQLLERLDKINLNEGVKYNFPVKKKNPFADLEQEEGDLLDVGDDSEAEEHEEYKKSDSGQLDIKEEGVVSSSVAGASKSNPPVSKLPSKTNKALPNKSKKSKSSLKKSKAPSRKQNEPKNEEVRDSTVGNLVFDIDPLLYIDYRKFNYEEEFVRRFYDRHTNNDKKSSSSLNSRSKVKSRRSLADRRNSLYAKFITEPEPTWPPTKNIGVRCEFVRRNEDNTIVMHLKYTEKYALEQIAFLQATERMDYNSNMVLLNNSPYHLCSLLQVSDILRTENKNEMADEFVRKCIFAIQASIPSTVDIYSGKVIFPYFHYENRVFHLALIRMIDIVVSKGCWDAALELSKLLLNLDPNKDPFAVLTIIDYYAIRSNKFEWFLEFAHNEDCFFFMSELPNFMYSIALSYYELYNEFKKKDPQDSSCANLLKKSSNLLRKAIMKYPSAIYELKRYCEWNNSKFDSPKFKRTDVEHRFRILIALFAKNSFTIWKIPEIFSWLNSNVDAVINDIPLPSKIPPSCDDLSPEITEPLIPLYRRIVTTTEEPYLRQLIPKKYTQQTKHILDPLPPLNE